MDPVDLTTNTRFHRLTWIGTGKTFSNSLPQEVYDAKREVLKVPDVILAQLPGSVALVHEFLRHPLPPQSGNLNFHRTEEWFSTNMPLTCPEVLLKSPIPSEKVLEKLDTTVGQMWFDGASSIVDPRFNGGAERFPPWALSLWKKIQKVIGDQKQWNSSVRWLELITHPEDTVAQTKSFVGGLPWNKQLCSIGGSTLEFAGFLGASWLSDTQIDMMVNVLRSRMTTEEQIKGTLLEPMVLSWELVIVSTEKKGPMISPYLSRLTDQIKAGIMTIWFPINVNENHWVAGRVDCENYTFAFGEL